MASGSGIGEYTMPSLDQEIQVGVGKMFSPNGGSVKM
jgi:hypothetical protein